MKVAINALHIKWGVNAGTETYLTNIVLPWYENRSSNTSFTMFCSSIPPWWEGEKEHFRIKVYKSGRRLVGRILLEQLLLPLSDYRNYDVIFNPAFVSSIFSGTKQVVTIHDGFAWLFPREIGILRSLYWRIAVPTSARRSFGVIAVSNSTARDIVRFCHIDESKITVIPEGSSHLHRLHQDESILFRNNLSHRSYFLCVGIFKEMKNPWKILQAYLGYCDRVSDKTKPKNLVLTGAVVGKMGYSILNAFKSTPGVVVVGRANDRELAALYKNSAGLIFPSLYEGFGIPILEAQSLGCPVVTSRISSMPEVAGNAAIYVNHLDVESIRNAMHELHTSNMDHLIKSGICNSSKFSWAVASKKTMSLFENIISSHER
jgi:glycosyltransferase involved in cell wall biosynthesis